MECSTHTEIHTQRCAHTHTQRYTNMHKHRDTCTHTAPAPYVKRRLLGVIGQRYTEMHKQRQTRAQTHTHTHTHTHTTPPLTLMDASLVYFVSEAPASDAPPSLDRIDALIWDWGTPCRTCMYVCMCLCVCVCMSMCVCLRVYASVCVGSTNRSFGCQDCFGRGYKV